MRGRHAAPEAPAAPAQANTQSTAASQSPEAATLDV